MRPKRDLHLDYSELKTDKFDGPKTKNRRDNAKRQSNRRRRLLDKKVIEEEFGDVAELVDAPG